MNLKREQFVILRSKPDYQYLGAFNVGLHTFTNTQTSDMMKFKYEVKLCSCSITQDLLQCHVIWRTQSSVSLRVHF